jgi:hypothetical protein
MLTSFAVVAFHVTLHTTTPTCANVLQERGGCATVVARLRTTEARGIEGTPEDLNARIEQFGENRFPEPPFESAYRLPPPSHVLPQM